MILPLRSSRGGTETKCVLSSQDSRSCAAGRGRDPGGLLGGEVTSVEPGREKLTENLGAGRSKEAARSDPLRSHELRDGHRTNNSVDTRRGREWRAVKQARGEVAPGGEDDRGG